MANSGAINARGVDRPHVREGLSFDPFDGFAGGADSLGAVTCMEVAERSSSHSSMEPINSLVGQSDRVRFSAPTPDLGAENHVDERGLSLQTVFAKYGCSTFDIIRERFKSDLLSGRCIASIRLCMLPARK